MIDNLQICGSMTQGMVNELKTEVVCINIKRLLGLAELWSESEGKTKVHQKIKSSRFWAAESGAPKKDSPCQFSLLLWTDLHPTPSKGAGRQAKCHSCIDRMMPC